MKNKDLRKQQYIECLEDKNVFHNLEEVLEWFYDRKRNLDAKVTEIPLADVEGGWGYEFGTGNLTHTTGGFFSVIGVQTETNIRENGTGWNQPMVDQGTKSSVAGLLKKDFKGIPHYLVEAKFEPGNYGLILFSPTMQVTYSNLDKLHKGRKPLYSEFFEENNTDKTIFEHWYPEDGGRFFKKRVKNMLVETEKDIEVSEGHIWLTMYQIKELLKRNNLVNPHLRSIIAYL